MCCHAVNYFSLLQASNPQDVEESSMISSAAMAVDVNPDNFIELLDNYSITVHVKLIPI